MGSTARMFVEWMTAYLRASAQEKWPAGRTACGPGVNVRKGADRVDKRLDNIRVAHRLPTLIHPWPTLRRGDEWRPHGPQPPPFFDKTTKTRTLNTQIAKVNNP